MTKIKQKTERMFKTQCSEGAERKRVRTNNVKRELTAEGKKDFEQTLFRQNPAKERERERERRVSRERERERERD